MAIFMSDEMFAYTLWLLHHAERAKSAETISRKAREGAKLRKGSLRSQITPDIQHREHRDH
jgi:hypothetical protein